MAEHDADVVPRSSGFGAGGQEYTRFAGGECVCGWVGPNRRWTSKAKEDVDKHLAKQARSDTPPTTDRKD